MRHLRSLDGIRGVALLLVMFFHFGWFAAGWVGVQLFFVLSGYLITNGLLNSKPKPLRRFLSTFHWHRALRIFPVLYLFMLACALSYAFTGAPATFKNDWPWLVTFTTNFARLRPADVSPAFVHIWSLAVEQQFYIVWPLLVYFSPARVFKVLVFGIILCAPLLRLWIFTTCIKDGLSETYAGMAVYVFPLCQFDAFAAGALITLFSTKRNRYIGPAFIAVLTATAACGAGKLIYEYFDSSGVFLSSLGYEMYLIKAKGYVWGYSLINILSTLAIACILQGIGPLKLLETKLLAWVGKISYGAYVYHVPLLLIETGLLEQFGVRIHGIFKICYFLIWLATVAVASAASYRWLEKPVLKFKHYWENPVQAEL